MTNELKQQIMDEIEKQSNVFIKANKNEYRIRCPICGDSQKNLRDAHCYIKFSYDATEPLLYHCFKCNASGIINKSFLKKLQIKGDILNRISNNRYNRVQSYKKADINILTGTPQLFTPQTRYLEKRLGYLFDVDELDKFKIVWNMSNLYPYISSDRIKNSMPNNNESISFLSDDKSTLLTRFFDDKNGRWRKIKLFPSDGKSMYTLKTTFDLFNHRHSGNDASEIWIAEGIMDVISLYKKRQKSEYSNSTSIAYIGVLGSDYISGIDYAISKGMFGKWVELKICIDNDIDIKSLIEELRKYKWLYRTIYIVQNIDEKDFGVPPERMWLSFKKVK